MTGPRRSGPSEGGAARAMTPTERGRLLAGWNDTARDVPGATLAGLFEAQAARVPDAVAVACGDAVLSYAELDGRAGRLAAYLTSLGAGPERLVAVVMDKSAEVFVAWLGVAKSGAAFLPVDPAYPAERIGFMLADARPDLVVTTVAAASSLPAVAGGDPPRVVLDDPVLAGMLARQEPGDVAGLHRAGLADPAYVIYTSGSAGRPKGTVVTHRGLASLAASMAAGFGIGPGSRVLQLASLSFDAAVMEVLMAWPAGAALVVPEPGPLAGEALADTLDELRTAYSRAWAHKFYASGASMANGAGIAVAPSPNALAGADLYNLRRDVEGLPYNRAATLKQPPAAAAEAALMHFELINAGANSQGAWLSYSGCTIRIVNGAGQGLADVRERYQEPATMTQPDIVICAGAVDLGVPATLIASGRGASIMRPARGGPARWLTRQQARTELGL